MLAVGFLSPGSPEPSSFLLAAFRESLKEASYIEGNNVTIEYRWARGHYDELQALAADLVRRRVAAIAATGGTISAQAARAATSTIPIVFNVGDDPIKSGLVASFNRPGGNVTGVNTMSPALETKRLGLLRELVPSPGMVAVLLNAANPDVGPQRQDINAAATAVGQALGFFYARNESDLEAVFGALVQQRAGALLVGNDVFFTNQRRQIVELAAHHAVPAMYAFHFEVECLGGNMYRPRSAKQTVGWNALLGADQSSTEYSRLIASRKAAIPAGDFKWCTRFEAAASAISCRNLGASRRSQSQTTL